MPNVLRHLLGIPAGVVLVLLTWLGAGWASQQVSRQMAQYFQPRYDGTTLLAVALIVITGVALGLAASARFMSPVSALIPGAVLTVLGLAGMLVPPHLTSFMVDINPFGVGLATYTLSAMGVYPMVGLLLLVSGIPPHRWRAAPARGPAHPMVQANPGT